MFMAFIAIFVAIAIDSNLETPSRLQIVISSDGTSSFYDKLTAIRKKATLGYGLVKDCNYIFDAGHPLSATPNLAT